MNYGKGSLLFVYGTLRRGASSDLSRNEGVQFRGSARINGKLYNLGWFPGVKLTDKAGAPFDNSSPYVLGDVFELKQDSVTKTLDMYEGYPSLYDRQVVELHDGRQAWVYTYNGRVKETDLIESGDWPTESPKDEVLVEYEIPHDIGGEA